MPAEQGRGFCASSTARLGAVLLFVPAPNMAAAAGFVQHREATAGSPGKRAAMRRGAARTRGPHAQTTLQDAAAQPACLHALSDYWARRTARRPAPCPSTP